MQYTRWMVLPWLLAASFSMSCNAMPPPPTELAFDAGVQPRKAAGPVALQHAVDIDGLIMLPDSPFLITGPEQIVFNSAADKCQTEGRVDNPDAPAIAFRRADGKVVMLANNTLNYYFEGGSFDTLKRVCTSMLVSPYDRDPAAYKNWEWLRSFYTEDGKKVLALIHNEYHGWEFSGECPRKKRFEDNDYLNCWWASTTWAWSEDGGRTFRQAPPPGNVVAALPFGFKANTGRVGLSSPTQILRSPVDGKYYVMIRAELDVGAQRKGMCLMQGSTLDPTTWRAWDGAGFNVKFEDPYRSSKALKPEAHACAPVYDAGLWSVVYSSYYKAFIGLGQAGRHLIITRSPDLIHWSRPERAFEFVKFGRWKPGDEAGTAYYSLLDHDSPTRNFDRIDQTAYLYFVRWHTRNGRVDNANRDLVRVPVEFR